MSVEVEVRGHNPAWRAVCADGGRFDEIERDTPLSRHKPDSGQPDDDLVTIFFIVESLRPKGERVTPMHEIASRVGGPCSNFTPSVRCGDER